MKMAPEINTIMLINSIKMRPALYNKNDSMYYSQNKYKFKLWREVCQEVYKHWDKMAPQSKFKHARELQKRWKNLRTCFARELSLQKQDKLFEEKNVPFKTRKKYEYFDSLIFLLDSNNVKSTTNNNNGSNEEDPLDPNGTTFEQTTMEMEDADSDDQEVRTHNNLDNFKASSSSQIKIEEPFPQPIKNERPLEYKLVDMFRDTTSSENDDDRMFALSLVPLFRNLNPKKKMEARIEALKFLQHYQNDE